MYIVQSFEWICWSYGGVAVQGHVQHGGVFNDYHAFRPLYTCGLDASIMKMKLTITIDPWC